MNDDSITTVLNKLIYRQLLTITYQSEHYTNYNIKQSILHFAVGMLLLLFFLF